MNTARDARPQDNPTITPQCTIPCQGWGMWRTRITRRMIAAVSEDVDLQDRESWMWGLFTRFDPARDVVFSEVALHGSWPVARGVLGIDATFKPGYPHPVVMTDDIKQLVERRWQEYGL